MNGESTILLFVRVGFSLVFVLGMIWIVARIARRRGRIAARQSDTTIDVVARRQVGRRGSLAVVESAGRRFLVGVTDTRIDLVAELSSSDGAPIEVSTGRTVVAPAIELPKELKELDVVDRTPVVVDRTPVVIDAQESAAPRRESLVDTLRGLTVRR